MARGSTEVTAVRDELVLAALRFIRDATPQGIGVEAVADHVATSRRSLEGRFRQVEKSGSHGPSLIEHSHALGDVTSNGDDDTHPLLRHFLTPLNITAADASKTYDASPWNDPTASYDGFKPGEDASDLAGTAAFSGNALGPVNAGTYTLEYDGYYSHQHGYDIAYDAGTLEINPLVLSPTLVGQVSKPFDATTQARLAADHYKLAGILAGVFPQPRLS